MSVFHAVSYFRIFCSLEIPGRSQEFQDCMRNADIRQALGIETNLLDEVVQRRLRWFGRAERMPVDRIPHNALYAIFKGKRNKRQTKTTLDR